MDMTPVLPSAVPVESAEFQRFGRCTDVSCDGKSDGKLAPNGKVLAVHRRGRRANRDSRNSRNTVYSRPDSITRGGNGL